MSTSHTTPAGVTINVDDVTGWVQLVRTEKSENGRLYLGGYSIRYDRHGKFVAQTPVSWYGWLGFQDS